MASPVVQAAPANDPQIAINFPKAEALGTIDVTIHIMAPPKIVWEVLTETARWSQWMPYAARVQYLSEAAAQALPPVMKKDLPFFESLLQVHPHAAPPPSAMGKSHRVAYESYDLPWPIKNDWVVRKYRFDAQRAAAHYFSASWDKVYDPEEPGSDGYWFIEPADEGATASTFRYHLRVKAKRGLALAMFQIGVKKILKTQIRAVRTEAERRAALHK